MKKKLKILICILICILTINTYSMAATSKKNSNNNTSSGPKIMIQIDKEACTKLGLVFVVAFIFVYVMENIPKWRYQYSKKVAKYNDYIARNSVPKTVEPIIDVRQSHIYAYKIKEIDPLFVESKFLSWTKSLFAEMQRAWTARDWEPIRIFETEELFAQHKSQVQSYIDLKHINVLDRVSIKYATIYKFRQEDGKDILDIALKVAMKNYVIDEATQELVDGDPYKDFIRVYKLTFERKTGVLTKPGKMKISTTNCPNCGATTEIIASGKCAYCGSVITTGNYSWVLSGIEQLVG